MKAIFLLLRPRHYLKNIFIFAPLLFAFSFTQAHILKALIAFALFSLMASAVYIFNDWKDIEDDRLHPQKKNRPLASGKVSIRVAWFVLFGLVFLSLSLAYLESPNLCIVLSIYFGINILYSVKLKHIALVDISLIAVGFVLRLFAGSSATDIPLSVWIVTLTYLLALFIALAKRRDDVLLASRGMQTRKSIDGYSLEFINIAMTLMAGVVIVSYILYTISTDIMVQMHTHYLYVTSAFVILGVMRYMQLTFVEEKSGTPTLLVVGDPFLRTTLFFWLISFLAIVLI